MTQKKIEGLVEAVTTFDVELRRYEGLVHELAKAPLTSDKQATRAKKLLEECAESEQNLVGLLSGFVEAMRAAQTRQEKAMADRVSGADRIEERITLRHELLARLAKLGEHARSASEPLAALVADRSEPLSKAQLADSLREIGAQTEAIAAEADSLGADAQAAEWLDIARDADSLRQQLRAARKKLGAAVGESSANGDSNGKASH